jgi:hypothetical protein
MIALSKPITDPEVEAAATYFSALQPRKRIKVVESDTAPKTYVAGLLWAAAEGGEREPLGQRILEVPDDLIRFESRDPRSTFTAYVPVGSLAKGEALVTKGAGKTLACAPCHGPDLKGLGRCRESPAARRATCFASSMTSVMARAPASGAR